jgi:hypothetical protein
MLARTILGMHPALAPTGKSSFLPSSFLHLSSKLHDHFLLLSLLFLTFSEFFLAIFLMTVSVLFLISFSHNFSYL